MNKQRRESHQQKLTQQTQRPKTLNEWLRNGLVFCLHEKKKSWSLLRILTWWISCQIMWLNRILHQLAPCCALQFKCAQSANCPHMALSLCCWASLPLPGRLVQVANTKSLCDHAGICSQWDTHSFQWTHTCLVEHNLKRGLKNLRIPWMPQASIQGAVSVNPVPCKEYHT